MGTKQSEATPLPVFTIGHSRRPIPEFVALLQEAEVALVVDVRSIPRSRTNPQYNQDSLGETLAPFHIGYSHIAALGGRRGKQKVDPSVNAYWTVDAFHNYADYAMGDAFGAGLAELRERGARRRCAIMCAEAVWWRCHRRIITDYLLNAGDEVFHILAPHNIKAAALTPAAKPTDNVLTYPATSDISPQGSFGF